MQSQTSYVISKAQFSFKLQFFVEVLFFLYYAKNLSLE